MKKLFSAIDLRDLCALIGAGLLVYGVYELQREAGFIVAGSLLLMFAVSAARR